jgi:low temperature requirement protein LtrA
LLLAVLWWAWSAYAWLTNTLDPDEGGVRIAMLAATAAMLVVSLAAPHAFGRDAMTFAVAYIVVRGFHLVLYVLAGRDDRDLLRAVLRVVPTVALSGALLVTAAFLDGSAALACWAAAVAIDYGGVLVGHMRGWRLAPDHFVERFGQIILIALGESIVAFGAGAAGVMLDGDVIVAALLGFCVVACLWWSYFDWVVIVAQRHLAELEGTERATLARDGYSYLHLPMVGGIVLFAFGLTTALHDPRHSLAVVPSVGLVGGVALYLLAHVGFRMRIGGGLGHGRPIATVALVVLLPFASHVPALVALGLVAAVCIGLIAYEFFRYRDSRAQIRGRERELVRRRRAPRAARRHERGSRRG